MSDEQMMLLGADGWDTEGYRLEHLAFLNSCIQEGNMRVHNPHHHWGQKKVGESGTSLKTIFQIGSRAFSLFCSEAATRTRKQLKFLLQCGEI